MKDIQATLRRIDDEITFCRQEIARQQVSIVRLEDTRRVLMGIAESDQASREAGTAERLGAINGSHARPEIIVRKIGTVDKKARKPRAGAIGESTMMRQKILDVLKGPMTPAEIGDKLGIPRGEEHRKVMHNALYTLRIRGKLDRVGGGNGDRTARYVPMAQQ